MTVIAESEKIVTELRTQLAQKERELNLLCCEIDNLISVDPTTGVMNRRVLNELLKHELLRSRRTDRSFCFVIIDVDHLHQINDRYGYQVGDVVLKTFLNTTARLMRELDRFGRINGDQFGIIMPLTDLDSGRTAMTRLYAAVQECDWNRITPGLAVTFSAGMTDNADGDTVDSLLQRAEAALMQAKFDCRGTVVIEQASADNPGAIP